jgi:hypothetical protein
MCTERPFRRVWRQRFLAPLLHHLDVAGRGHICEAADAEPIWN